MKLSLLLSVLMMTAASVFGAAVAESSNVFGVLKIDSSSSRTIVAVPWVAAGVEAGDVKVADLVKTANLTVGDTLHYYNGSNFTTWTLVAGAQDEAPVWSSANQVSRNAEVEPSPSADEQGLSRGAAIILIRQNPTTPFYLQGQVATTAAVTTELASGSAVSPAYSLIAPPKAQSTDINLNAATWSGIGANDLIIVQQDGGKNIQCKYRDSSWKKVTWSTDVIREEQLTEDPPAIPVGTGCWFVSQSGGSPSVTW